MTVPNNGQIVNGGGNYGKLCYWFRMGKKIFKSPTGSLQHVIFNFIARNNKNNMFMDNVKKLRQ